MNKIVLRKTTSAIFLAIVLVVGTIALSFPLFIVGTAQATSDHDKDYDEDDKKSYGKDKDDDKSKDSSSSSVSIKKVKCNNINVNLNGVDVEIGVPHGNGPISVAQEAEDDEEQKSNSIKSNDDENYNGKDAQSDSETNSRIVCINNNNNIVVVEVEPPTCEDCFTTILSEEELDDLIQAIEEDSEGIVSSLEELCDFIDDTSGLNEDRAFISDRLFVLGGDVGISEDKINKILDCLEEVFNVDFPREVIEEPLTAQQMKWKS